jgi:NADH:ubiquinone oxidoreductase subunit 2 (subunit N)
MNAEQLDILRIVFTIVFALSGIVLVVLGVKEAENKKKQRTLFMCGVGSLTFSIFGLSLLVKSQEIKDILISIAALSGIILNGLVVGFIIVDHRQQKK